MNPTVLLVCSYIIGSVPFGYIAGIIKGIDVRKIGSENIGATNILRTMGWKYGILVFILDTLKGTLPVLSASKVGFPPYLIIACGACAILGHLFPIWLKFKGGKGVATALGVIIGINPPVAAISFAIFLAVLFATRIVSLSSLIAVFCNFMFLLTMQKHYEYTIFGAVAATAIIIKHIPNIKRLIKNEEPRIRTGGAQNDK